VRSKVLFECFQGLLAGSNVLKNMLGNVFSRESCLVLVEVKPAVQLDLSVLLFHALIGSRNKQIPFAKEPCRTNLGLFHQNAL